MRDLVIAIAAALLVTGCTKVDDPSPEIRVLADRWRVAELSNDAFAVGPLLHAKFVYVGPDGAASTREQDLSAIADPSLHLGSFEVADVSINCVGRVCIERGTEILADARFGEQRLDGRYRYVTVWQEFDGEWQAVYAQETRITE